MNGEYQRLMIFCDFDGTISQNDVLNKIFSKFGGPEVQKLEEKFKSGELDDRETLTRKWKRVKLDYQKFRDFIIREVKLDPYFKDFLELVSEKNIDFSILSGGFLNYIELLLAHNNITRGIPIYGNRLQFDGERVTPVFLHDIDSCHQSFGVCGSCKWKIIKDQAPEQKKVIYIGDGLTDRCPAEEVDELLVKRGKLLEEYCQKQGLNYHSFGDFSDIIKYVFKDKDKI